MDKEIRKKVEQEMENIIDNLDNKDERTKEYFASVANASKLQGILVTTEDLELKKDKNNFDEKYRNAQLNFEKRKWKEDIHQKELDRQNEEKRINNQHDERMAEIEVNRIKAENENMILKQNQEKLDKEFRETRRRDWLIFGGKLITFVGIVILNVCMHKDELTFERIDNGITPSRCKTYDAVIGRVSEIVMK